ncbi:MAG: hypothetical protein ACKN83_03405, partial [Vulcanococcus sp.]
MGSASRPAAWLTTPWISRSRWALDGTKVQANASKHKAIAEGFEGLTATECSRDVKPAGRLSP